VAVFITVANTFTNFHQDSCLFSGPRFFYYFCKLATDSLGDEEDIIKTATRIFLLSSEVELFDCLSYRHSDCFAYISLGFVSEEIL
jgi:hypothetical protein